MKSPMKSIFLIFSFFSPKTQLIYSNPIDRSTSENAVLISRQTLNSYKTINSRFQRRLRALMPSEAYSQVDLSTFTLIITLKNTQGINHKNGKDWVEHQVGTTKFADFFLANEIVKFYENALEDIFVAISLSVVSIALLNLSAGLDVQVKLEAKFEGFLVLNALPETKPDELDIIVLSAFEDGPKEKFLFTLQGSGYTFLTDTVDVQMKMRDSTYIEKLNYRLQHSNHMNPLDRSSLSVKPSIVILSVVIGTVVILMLLTKRRLRTSAIKFNPRSCDRRGSTYCHSKDHSKNSTTLDVIDLKIKSKDSSDSKLEIIQIKMNQKDKISEENEAHEWIKNINLVYNRSVKCSVNEFHDTTDEERFETKQITSENKFRATISEKSLPITRGKSPILLCSESMASSTKVFGRVANEKGIEIEIKNENKVKIGLTTASSYCSLRTLRKENSPEEPHFYHGDICKCQKLNSSKEVINTITPAKTWHSDLSLHPKDTVHIAMDSNNDETNSILINGSESTWESTESSISERSKISDATTLSSLPVLEKKNLSLCNSLNISKCMSSAFHTDHKYDISSIPYSETTDTKKKQDGITEKKLIFGNKETTTISIGMNEFKTSCEMQEILNSSTSSSSRDVPSSSIYTFSKILLDNKTGIGGNIAIELESDRNSTTKSDEAKEKKKKPTCSKDNISVMAIENITERSAEHIVIDQAKGARSLSIKGSIRKNETIEQEIISKESTFSVDMKHQKNEGSGSQQETGKTNCNTSTDPSVKMLQKRQRFFLSLSFDNSLDGGATIQSKYGTVGFKQINSLNSFSCQNSLNSVSCQDAIAGSFYVGNSKHHENSNIKLKY